MIRERITTEREMNQLEKDMYVEAPILIGSPAEKVKRLAARQKRMVELLAQVDSHSRRHLFTVSGSYPEHHLIPVHPSAASILCEASDPDTAATDQEENQAPPLRCCAAARRGIQQIRSHEEGEAPPPLSQFSTQLRRRLASSTAQRRRLSSSASPSLPLLCCPLSLTRRRGAQPSCSINARRQCRRKSFAGDPVKAYVTGQRGATTGMEFRSTKGNFGQ
ncbi:hypothetical protein Droror1_Dr00018471 [Drosera rotundifolia]